VAGGERPCAGRMRRVFIRIRFLFLGIYIVLQLGSFATVQAGASV